MATRRNSRSSSLNTDSESRRRSGQRENMGPDNINRYEHARGNWKDYDEDRYMSNNRDTGYHWCEGDFDEDDFG